MKLKESLNERTVMKKGEIRALRPPPSNTLSIIFALSHIEKDYIFSTIFNLLYRIPPN